MPNRVLLIDKDNIPFGVERRGNMPKVTMDEFKLCVAAGLIPGWSHLNKFGRNSDCDQAGSITAVNLGRTIWDGGVAGAANWVGPTAARIHQIASTNANDGAGTNAGALRIKLLGLDADFKLASEEILLNGTGDVPTTRAYWMIYRMYVLSAGATGYNEGNITATADTDGTVTAQISIGNNQTLMAIFQIPENTLGLMPLYYASIHKSGGAAKFADIFLMSMLRGGVWRVRDATDVASDGGIMVQRFYEPFKTFQPEELIQVIANPSADAQDISGGFDLYLVDRDIL